MKKLILLICLSSLVLITGAKPEPVKFGNGIKFTATTLAQSIRMAKEQKKLIFIDIYATWCAPCAMLKLRTFSSKKAGDFFNENFVNLSLNGEEGEGLQLVRAYKLTAYPTMIILDNTGRPIIVTMGYLDANTLIKFGKAGIEKSAQ